jgi:aquaporin Z
MRKLLVEFIGSFFLVFTVGMTVIEPGVGNLAPLAIGLALAVMIYAGGHISGGHYNPAVTLGVWFRKGISDLEAVGYMAAQVLAAFAAAGLTRYLKGDPLVLPISINPVQAILAEVVGTFALVYVVLNVATSKGTAGNSFYGLAIGLTVTVMAYAVGGLSGGAFNPAVAVGISTLHLTSWNNFWVYLIGDIAGALTAARLFRFVNGQDK